MSTLPRRAGWITTAWPTLALAVVLALLWSRAQDGGTSGYFENVAMLRQLKQLDASWELDVLKSKMGMNSNYDPLVDSLAQLNQLRERLELVATTQAAGGNALLNASHALHRAIEDKTLLIERFKSHNAILRNSLVFLPTAASDVEEAVTAAGSGADPGLRRLVSDIKDALLDIMVYSHAPADAVAQDVAADLARMQRLRTALAPAARLALENFDLHVRTVLREQPVVDGLLGAIAAVPTAPRVDELDNLLGSEQQDTALQAQRNRQYLLSFTAALAGLLVFAAVSLIRSHAVIHRVNHELQEANATLEQRVAARTRDLGEAQSQLVTTARQAGMAEVANNVLHNVGNVLNSVNVSAGFVVGRLLDSKSRGLAKAVALMNEHAAALGAFLTCDPRGKLLPAYLGGLASALEDERLGLIAELRSLTHSIDHIKDIVAGQQAYSGASGLVETVQVDALVDDALRIGGIAFADDRLTVVRELAAVPPLMLDKPRLMQILVNLISNAKQAMETVSDRPALMTLRSQLRDGGDGRCRLVIEVGDAGEGIRPEHLNRIFTHGFTTRRNGHGFGLHSCALAAREMGGSLAVHSDGPGRGATFTLDLPIQAPENVE